MLLCVDKEVVEAIDQDEIGIRSKADNILKKMQDKQLDWSIIEDILLRLEKYEVIRQLRAERDLIQTNLGEILFFNTMSVKSNNPYVTRCSPDGIEDANSEDFSKDPILTYNPSNYSYCFLE